MTPLLVAVALPYLALAATIAAVAVAVYLCTHQHGPRGESVPRRLIPTAALVLASLPLVYVELLWARALSDEHLRLGKPLFALVTAAAVALVAARLHVAPGRPHPVRRALAELLVCAAALAAGLAAMQPELGTPQDRLAVIVALDRSRSIDLVPSADQRVRAELDVAERAMRDGDRIAIVAFGSDARTEEPLRPRTDMRTPQRAEVGRDATDIASAIRRSLAEVPSDAAARIVIVSDGVATRGDALQSAAAAVAAQVPVDVLPLDQATVPDVRVVALRAPPRASEREPIELRVVTSAPTDTDVEIRVRRDGQLIKRSRARISAGEDVLRIRELAPAPGLHRYDVELTAEDPSKDQAAEDNAASAFVRVRGLSTALVIEGDQGMAAFVARSLEAAAFRVETASGASMPLDLAGLAGFDLVVFSDVRASDLSPTTIEALASYTRDLGGGLILLGGDRSMGPGGYGRTPLEEVSPVSFDIKQERKRASLAEVISIDYSGSMSANVGGHTKLDLANEAAARSAMLLGGTDRLGVAHVDTHNAWTVPLGPVTDPASIARAIKGTKVGGGGILVDLALDEAYRALDAERANLKHLLLFSDGDDAENLPGCRAKVAGALSRGITTSVVALGRGKDVAELEVLSKLGSGRFYLIEDATRLPAVFAQETIIAARSSINEVDFKPSLASPGAVTRGVDLGAAPALHGYVVTLPKGRATVHLVGPESDPLLASWSVGVGRSAAFTSDLKDRWGKAWTTWPDAARLVGQMGRDVARRADDPRVRLEADAASGELHVRATVVGDDGKAQTFRRLRVHVGGPDGFTRALPLEPVGAGAYAATIPLDRPGTYIASAVDELTSELVGSTGAALSAGDELRPTGTDRLLLGRIAAATSGKVRHTLADVFLDRAARRFSYAPMQGPLLIAAAALFLLAVAARKLAFPEGLQRAVEGITRRKAPAAEPEATQGAPTMHALQEARARRRALEAPKADLGEAAPQRPPPRPAPTSASSVHQNAQPTAPVPPAPQPAPHAQAPARQKTAAEILLERRRGKGRPPGA